MASDPHATGSRAADEAALERGIADEERRNPALKRARHATSNRVQVGDRVVDPDAIEGTVVKIEPCALVRYNGSPPYYERWPVSTLKRDEA